jgi:hypothetical protein
MRICELALARGVFAQAIRPPTVPAMTSRLRLAVMATHRPAELVAAAQTLAAAARAAGFEPRQSQGLAAKVDLDRVGVEADWDDADADWAGSHPDWAEPSSESTRRAA